MYHVGVFPMVHPLGCKFQVILCGNESSVVKSVWEMILVP